MTPVPVIELQRRLTLVGAIRAGGEKQPRAPGRKLETWRITSPRASLIEQAAELYGGQVSPWESPNGAEYQVYTEATELPALLMPGYSLRQSYELWEGATRRVRLCDGIDEELSGRPCLCNGEGVDKCDLYTRLVVALPELDTVLGWRVITKGLSAGHELPTMMALVEARAGDHSFVPVRLRLDQRRGVKDGQVVRFVVPTLDLDVSYLALAAPARDGRELPERTGAAPVPGRELAIEQALTSAVSPSHPRVQSGRQAADMGQAPERHHAGPPDVAPEDDLPAPAQDSRPRRNRLDVLVGRLRQAGHITTEQVYDAIAGLREVSREDLAAEVGGVDAVDGETLHWAPLREGLTHHEAVQLTGWLVEKERRVELAEAAATGPGDLPEGY